MTAYPLSITYENGDFVVRSRDLPELQTSGSTRREAEELAEDALGVVLSAYGEKGHPVPPPSSAERDEVLVFPFIERDTDGGVAAEVARLQTADTQAGDEDAACDRRAEQSWLEYRDFARTPNDDPLGR